jgi:hypothetical protein
MPLPYGRELEGPGLYGRGSGKLGAPAPGGRGSGRGRPLRGEVGVEADEGPLGRGRWSRGEEGRPDDRTGNKEHYGVSRVEYWNVKI